MALDFNFELTDKGNRLLAKAIAGASLKFTRFAIGSGKLTTQLPTELGDLIQPVLNYLEVSVLKPLDRAALVGCQVNNQDIVSGFLWTETGLFAHDPDLGEILFCYANLGTTGIPVPPNTESSYLRKVRITMKWSSTAEIHINYNQSGIYALKEEVGDLEELTTDNRINIVAAINELKEKVNDMGFFFGDDGTKYRWGKDEIGVYYEDVVDPNAPKELILQLSEGGDTGYYAEVEGQTKAIENAVSRKEDLTEGKILFELLEKGEAWK